MNRNVVVIAGGYSVKSYDLSKLPTPYRSSTQKGGPVYIGVNDAGHILSCEHVITMDRLWFEHRYGAVVRDTSVRKFWIRKGINKIIPELDPKVIEFDCDPEVAPYLSAKGVVFNGSNSGTVAINLAYQLSLKNIFLVGFDMQKGPNEEPYWYPPYPWNAKGGTKPAKYEIWAQEFAQAAGQIKSVGLAIYNVNHRSAIKAFPKITFEDMLCRLG